MCPWTRSVLSFSMGEVLVFVTFLRESQASQKAKAWNNGSVILESLAEVCYQVQATPQNMVGGLAASEGSLLRCISLLSFRNDAADRVG